MIAVEFFSKVWIYIGGSRDFLGHAGPHTPTSLSRLANHEHNCLRKECGVPFGLKNRSEMGEFLCCSKLAMLAHDKSGQVWDLVPAIPSANSALIVVFTGL
jgi:hypothetical protein